MQAKICPKCKAENKLSNASCSSCYGSLEGALSTEVPDPVVPPAQESDESAQPQIGSAPQVPAVGESPGMPQVGGSPGIPQVGVQPPAAGPPPTSEPSPYGPPPTGVYTPPSRENMQPIKRGPDIGAIVMIILLLGGAGFGAWWFLMRPKSPTEVVSAFIAASKAGDTEKIKACLSSSSKGLLDTPGVAEGFTKGFQNSQSQGGTSTDNEPKIGEATFEGDKALVTVSANKPASASGGMDQSLQMVLVKEEGKWKIDLQQTIQRAMQKMFGEMMKRGYKMPPGMKPFGR